jgi:hypothetical protein
LLFAGDFGQLPPVLDVALYSKKNGASASSRIGKLAFGALDAYLLLDQPERQGLNSPLYAALSNLRELRTGAITSVDLAFWSSRSLLNIRHQTQDPREWSLDNPRLLHATCYNRDRDDINRTYILQAENVVTVRAVCAGTHATAAAHAQGGQALRIPRNAHFFPEMLVLLSVNLLPELGLENNTRGGVKSILYPPGGFNPQDTTQLPIIVVHFPGYTGPPWDPSNPTWVPIVPVERRCEYGCCSRRGLPLWPGKAGSIHSLQGLTVGDGKLFDRVILSWDRKAESRWPGIFYVGSSRAMAAHNLALSNPLSAEDLEAISRGPAWQAQKATVRSFERRARDTRDALKLRNEREWHSAHPWGSRYDFAQRLHRFIDTHGPFIAASNSIPQYAKDDVSSALQQWKASLIQLGYTRYAQP